MKTLVLTVLTATVASNVVGAGPKTRPAPSTASTGTTLHPIRAARVARDAQGEIQLTSEWIPLNGYSRRSDLTDAFDQFEACTPAGDIDSSVATEGAVPVGFVAALVNGPACIGGGDRFFFGADYNNPHLIADMTLEPGFAGATVDEITSAINYETGVPTPLVAIYLWYEEINTKGLAAVPVVAGPVAGVALDYGVVAPTLGGGYYTLLGDGLTPLGVALPASGDADGMEIMYAMALAPVVVFASPPGDGLGVQPMLWGTGDDEVPFPQFDRNGRSEPVQYDDDVILDFLWLDADGDGMYDEVYSYEYVGATAPGHLGAMFHIFATPIPDCPADFNGDGTVDFFDYDDFVLAFETPC